MDTWVTLESPASCKGCSADCRSTEKRVRIPFVLNGGPDVVLSLSARDSVRLMIHSVVLPLAGFIAGALAMRLVEAAEPWVIAGALTGLMLGVFACRKQTFNRIHIDRG